MRKLLIITLLTLAADLMASLSLATETVNSAADSSQQTERSISADLGLSGFIDVIGSYTNLDSDRMDFNIGQAELDLDRALSGKASLSIAAVYDNEARTVSLGVAEIGLTLYEQTSGFIRSASIAAGQFDVPFGIEYKEYASIDRKLVTSPLAVESTHGLWNDFGTYFSAELAWANFVCYAVNGTESSAEVTRRVIDLSTGLETDTVEQVDTSPENALGGRLGILPLKNLEIGGSYAVGLNRSGSSEMTLAGLDASWQWSRLVFKGEYIRHSINRTVARTDNNGFYIQSESRWDRWFVVGRYSSLTEDEFGRLSDMSAGAGYRLDERLELRGEYSRFVTRSGGAAYLQLLASF